MFDIGALQTKKKAPWHHTGFATALALILCMTYCEDILYK
jgi:hypothetical protein